MVVLNLDLLFTRLGFIASWLGVLAGLVLLVGLLAAGKEDALARKVLGTVTKTGDLEEVTQVTGRYEIWERTVQLIKGRPLQGWGLGANKELLKDHLQSTHNVLLHPTLAAGVFAGGLTLLLLMWNLINVFTLPNLLIRALSAYVIISGFTEDTLYETFPGACTLLWMICCLWPALGLAHRATPHEATVTPAAN
jgi:O-antigen ligase